MKPFIFEVKHIGKGSLCIMPAPRPNTLAEDMTHYMQMGIHKVVSLLEKQEATARGLAFEAHLCTELGMEFEQFPIPDQRIPKNTKAFNALVEHLYTELQAGKNISVHCYAGIGRTGVLAGSLLIRDGMEPGAAIDLMSRVRGRNMPQTQEQYEYLTGHDAPMLPAFAGAMEEHSSRSLSAGRNGWFRRLFAIS